MNNHINAIASRVALASLLALSAGAATAQTVSTFAGTVTFSSPKGVATDTAGNLYVADSGSNKIRKITTSGVVSTFAGSGTAGSTDGAGTAATFNSPRGLCVDSSGNVYVADYSGNKVRKITPAGAVMTLAGNGIAGSTDGAAATATFSGPQGICLDSQGNTYVCEYNGNKVRKITSAGVVTTLAGSGTIGSADGTGAAASFNRPSGLCADSSGNIYVAEMGNNKVRKITSAGVVTTLAGNGTASSLDGTGTAATFNQPQSISVDSSGNLYVADSTGHKIRKVTSAGVVSTFAGSGTAGSVDGIGTGASFNQPQGVFIDSRGSLYVGDTMNNKIRSISSAGGVSTLCGSGTAGATNTIVTGSLGVCADSQASVYVANAGFNNILKITWAGVVTTIAGSGVAGSADGTGTAATFNQPQGICVDSTLNLYVADTNNNKIRKVTSAGVVTTLAGSGSAAFADGTGAAASFNSPRSLCMDSSGNLYVADAMNNRIRKVTPSGVVTTVAGSGLMGSFDASGAAASFNQPQGICRDSSGNLYVADMLNNKIRKITPTGVVSTFAGSATAGSTNATGTGATFSGPRSICVDSAGNLYVADSSNLKVRKITTTAAVSTYAGSGAIGSVDGSAGSASFNQPMGVCADTSGYLYVADSNNRKIRKIVP